MRSIFFVFLFIATACGSKPLVQQGAQPVPQKPKYEKHEIDLNKIKTISDVRKILSLLFPEGMFLSVKEDSLKDAKSMSTVKHLLVDKKK